MHKLIIETTANKCDQKNDGPSFLTEIVQCPAMSQWIWNQSQIVQAAMFSWLA